MLSLTRIKFLSIAAAGALVALTAASTPARADELAQNLGPVGPHEPTLTTVGSKRVIAFYEPDSGHCAVNAVVWDNTDADTATLGVVEPGTTIRQSGGPLTGSPTTGRSDGRQVSPGPAFYF